MTDKFTIEHVIRPETHFNMASKHYHDHFEIYYLVNGERYYFIENRTYHVKKGDIVLINKYLLHRTITTENTNMPMKGFSSLMKLSDKFNSRILTLSLL